jgi:hypothetical protein
LCVTLCLILHLHRFFFSHVTYSSSSSSSSCSTAILLQMSPLSLSALLLLLLPSCALAGPYPASLYGLNPSQQLFRITPNGSYTILSDPSPYLTAQQLSCVDAVRGIFYYIGYDRSTQLPSLLGLSLADGSALSTTPLPFYDGTYIGVGQYLAVEPASARVFVGGQDTARNHIMGLVTPGSGEFEVLANLTSVLRDVFGGTSVFVPATNELWFELDLDIMILNLATKKVEVLPVSASYEILGMSLDPSTGVVVGLGGGPGQGVRTVVALHPGNRTITVTGQVPAYAMQMGGITAYDWAAKSIFWIAQKTGADPTSQWYMVQNAVSGGRTLSAAPLCGNGQLCPWSLHYA